MKLADADAGIEAAADQIDGLGVGDDVDADVGIGGEKARQHRRQHFAYGDAVDEQAQRAGRSFAEVGKIGEGGADRLGGRTDVGEQALAGLGQCHAAGGAMEQRQAETALQRLDRLADGAGRDAELVGGGAERAAADDREKLADAVKLVGAGHGWYSIDG